MGTRMRMGTQGGKGTVGEKERQEAEILEEKVASRRRKRDKVRTGT